MPKNINCITIIVITLEGTEKIKTEDKKRKKTKQSEEYLQPFQPAKFSVLAYKMSHNALQSDNDMCHITGSYIESNAVFFFSNRK